MEPDERPLEAAQRELREEMGCEAAEWISLGSYLMDPNRGVATGHLYLALNARIVAEPDSDDLEEQALISVSVAELEEAFLAGEFKVMSWSTLVGLALSHLRD